MADIFGKQRTVAATKAFASPEYFHLTTGAGSGMVQSVKAAYQRRIDSIYVVGDTSVYWGFFGGEGSMAIGRYVGGDFFANVTDDSGCGVISATGSVDGSNCTKGGAKVTFKNLALQGVGFTVQSGDTTILESMEYKVGELNTGGSA